MYDFFNPSFAHCRPTSRTCRHIQVIIEFTHLIFLPNFSHLKLLFYIFKIALLWRYNIKSRRIKDFNGLSVWCFTFKYLSVCMGTFPGTIAPDPTNTDCPQGSLLELLSVHLYPFFGCYPFCVFMLPIRYGTQIFPPRWLSWVRLIYLHV